VKTLYLDIFSGLSGDMFLGAMIDLGVDFPSLEKELRKLELTGYHLHCRRGQKAHLAGVKFDVHPQDHCPSQDHSPAEHHHHDHGEEHEHHDSPAHGGAEEHDHDHGQHQHHEGAHHSHGHSHEHTHADGTTHVHPHGHGPAGHDEPHAHDHLHDHDEPELEHRTFASIRELIQRSTLSDWVKTRAVAVFERIAVAEGRAHGLPTDQVHFHEVGAIDSIIDIVGACIALDLLGRPRIQASPVIEGTGFIQCAHGRYPIPAPATLAILGARGIALTQCDEPQELVTPTGAALLAEFVEQFGPMRGLVAERIGIGLGTRDNRTRPNVVRAILGTVNGSSAAGHDWEVDDVMVLETNLDDISSEVLGYFLERAMAAGALDVFHTPIQMKKSRPGVLLTVLATTADADRFSEMILQETSAFGVRRYAAERRKLRRQSRTFSTAWGDVSVKIGSLNGAVVQVAPEYEDCRRLADTAGVPLKAVYAAACQAARDATSREGSHGRP
jgi:uncharacterized protein (TIGR00299 family) protein